MPFINRDHSRADFDIVPHSCNGVFTEKVSRKKYLWHQADFEGMQEYLSTVNWMEILSTNLNAESLWSSFCNVLYTVIDMYVPTVDINNNCNRKYTARPKPIRRLQAHKRCP